MTQVDYADVQLKISESEAAGYVFDILTGQLTPQQYKKSKEWYLDLGSVVVEMPDLADCDTEELARLAKEALEDFVVKDDDSELIDPPCFNGRGKFSAEEIARSCQLWLERKAAAAKTKSEPAPNPPAAEVVARGETNPAPTSEEPTPESKAADRGRSMSMAEITALRLQLRRNGFNPIPVEGKAPSMKGWQQKVDVSEEEIRRWEKTYPRARNTGVLAKLTLGLDVDIKIEAAAKAAEDKAREFLLEHGDVYVRFGLPPKRLIPLRTDEPFKKLYRAFKAPDGGEHKIEILGDGQQWVAHGIHPDTRKPYSWFGSELTAIKRENLPYTRREDAERLLDAIAKVLIEEHSFVLTGTSKSKTVDNVVQLDFTRKSATSEEPTNYKVPPGLELEGEYEKLGEGIETYSWWDHLSPEHKDAALDHGLELIAKNSNLLKFGNNENWYRVATTVARSNAPHRGDIFVKHAGAVPGADSEEELRKKLAYCEKPRTETADITVGTFIKWAKQCGANFEPWLETYQSTIEPAKVKQRYEPVTRDAPELASLTPCGRRGSSRGIRTASTRTNFLSRWRANSSASSSTMSSSPAC